MPRTPPEPRNHVPHVDDLRAPNALLLALEGRAPWEYAATLAAMPWLRKLPRGDGHAVLVFPGLGANDFTTVPLRRFLDGLGYVTYPWRQGFNFGPRQGVLKRCNQTVRDLFAEHARPVSLIGWSLGGLYAREMAKELADHVRCVITLGTPFTGHPRATNAWRFFEFVSGQSVHDPVLTEQLRQAPPVPTTSIYSRSDGVVAWQACVGKASRLAENIEVESSHLGLVWHYDVLRIVADRLAQRRGEWKPWRDAPLAA